MATRRVVAESVRRPLPVLDLTSPHHGYRHDALVQLRSTSAGTSVRLTTWR